MARQVTARLATARVATAPVALAVRASRSPSFGAWALVGVCAVLLLLPDARAQSPYPAPVTIDNPGGPTRVVAGDFNSDGRTDLVVNSPTSGRIIFHLGGGGLTFGSRISINVGGRPSAIAVADMDGDGIDDLVWADEALGNVGVLYTRGANPVSFQTVVVRGQDEAVALALLDRDGDGWLDVVAAHRGADSISWYRNTGTGLRSWDVIEVGDGPASLALLRSPNRPPTLAIGQRGYLARDVLLLDPITSTLLGRVRLGTPGVVAADDVFGDQRDELLLTDASSGQVQVMGEDAAGSWNTVATFGAEPGALITRALESASADHLLLVAETTRNRMRVWRDAAGDGNFASQGSWYVGSGVEDFLLTDLSGDGAQEVVVPLTGANSVKILQTVGEALFAPRAQLTAALPIRVERDGGIDDSQRVAVLGLATREAWIYRLHAGPLELDTALVVPPNSKEVALADLDGQDESDLLVLDAATGVWRALALAGNGFAALELVAPVVGAEDFEVAQLVGGPALDLAVGDPTVPGLRIYEGDGAGNFSAHSTQTAEERIFVVRSRDLDLDGFADLVTLGEFDDLAIFYGSAVGPGPGVIYRVGGTPRDLAFGRYNTDAFPDILVTSAGQSSFAVLLSVFAGFYSVASRNSPTLYGSQNCEAFDVTGDGLDDALISGPGSSLMALHFATGNASLGAFVPIPISVPTTVAPLDMRAVQLDGDGIADLLVLDHFSGVIATILSDPLAGITMVSGTVTGWWDGEAVELAVTADARQTSEIELIRASDDGLLPLVPQGEGRWSARDAAPGPSVRAYVLRDRRGRELDRVEVVPAEQVTGADLDEPARMLPPRWSEGVVQLRFRLPGNPSPSVRVYDLRGRRVAELTAVRGEDGWFDARWDARDGAGRRAARARYLVRVQNVGAPAEKSLVTSVLLH